jgi:hypothetical protein
LGRIGQVQLDSAKHGIPDRPARRSVEVDRRHYRRFDRPHSLAAPSVRQLGGLDCGA